MCQNFLGASEVTRKEVAEEAKTCGRTYIIDAPNKRTKRATHPPPPELLCMLGTYALRRAQQPLARKGNT